MIRKEYLTFGKTNFSEKEIDEVRALNNYDLLSWEQQKTLYFHI